MRNHGANQNKSIPLDIGIWGTNCRLDNIHAAILSYKLSYYDNVIRRRREIAEKYHNTLCKFQEVRLPPNPSHDTKQFDIYQNFEFCTIYRDELRQFLKKNGVATIIQWGGFGIHQLKNLGIDANLPITDRFFKESLLLPLNHILTDTQVVYICNLLDAFFRSKDARI